MLHTVLAAVGMIINILHLLCICFTQLFSFSRLFSLFLLHAYLTLMDMGPGNCGREDFSICVQLCGSLQQQPQLKWKSAMFFQIQNFEK